MLVFWKQKFVLLAVPKTGTTALEQALLPLASAAILDPPGQKHLPARQYHNRLSNFFEQRGKHPMELVAVMREPVDWLGSWYRYRSRDQLAGKPNSTKDVSFDEFVLEWLKPNRAAFADVGSQANFLCDDIGNCLVHHLFRYDRMSDLIEFVESKLSCQLTLSRENVSPRKDLQLSDTVREKLEHQAAAEFTLWKSLAAD